MAGVLARALETSGVVASGSVAVAGRAGHPRGQFGGAATALAGVGGNGAGRWKVLAELIIVEELKLGRWQEADLKTRPKGDSVKAVLAARLWAETTKTVGWIAECLAMGTRGYLTRTDPFFLSEPSIVPPEKVRQRLYNIKNRPLLNIKNRPLF